MVGDLGMGARRSAATSIRERTAAVPDSTRRPAAEGQPDEQVGSRRRRKAKAHQLGRGYEYMDLEPAPSDSGAGSLERAAQGASGFGATVPTMPSMPMMPSTWRPNPD